MQSLILPFVGYGTRQERMHSHLNGERSSFWLIIRAGGPHLTEDQSSRVSVLKDQVREELRASSEAED